MFLEKFKKIIANKLAFFMLFGLMIILVSSFTQGRKYIFLISGIIIVLLSLYLLIDKNVMTRSIKIENNNEIEQTLDEDENAFKKKSLQERVKNPYLGVFLLGIGLGGIFTSCIGPIYGSILSIIYSEPINVQLTVQFIYALGLTLPFIIISAFIGKMYSVNRLVVKLYKYGSVIQRVFALFLLLIGIEIILSGYGIRGLLSIV